MSQRDTYSVDYLRRQQDLLSTYSPRVGPAAPSQSQEDQYRVLQLMDSARFKYPEDYLRTSGSEQSRIGALAGNTSDQLYARTMSPGRREGLPSLNSDTNRPIDPYASLSPSARGAIASPSVASPTTSQQIDPYLRAALSPASGRSDDYLRASLTRGQIDDLRAPLSPSARIDDLRPPLASRLEESLRSPILHNTLGSAKLDDSYRVPLSPAARLDDPALHRDTRAEDIAALRSPIHSSPRNALDDQRYASRLPETRNPVEDVLRSGITPASASTAAQPQRSLESYYAQLSSNRNDYLSTLSPRRLENVGHAFDPVSPALRSRTEEYLTRLQAESHSESRPAPPASALAPLPSRLESSAAAIHATPAATLEDPGLYHREPVPPPTTNSTAATAGTTRHDERSGTPTQSNEWVYKTIWLGSGDALKPQGLPPGVRIVISVSFEGDNLKPHDALVRAGVQCHKFQWDKPGDQVEGIELIHRLVSAEIPLLVHSTLGKSYAAALVVSYLVACVGMSYDGAVSTLVAGSPVCQPNIHLEVQLRNFENHFRRIKSEITKIDVLTGRASPQRSEVTQVPSLRPKAQPARKQSQPTAQRCRSPPTKRGGRGPTKSTMEK